MTQARTKKRASPRATTKTSRPASSKRQAVTSNSTAPEHATRTSERIRSIVERGASAHAFLLIGPRGVGKRDHAERFAQALACQSPKQGSACGDCASCALFDRPLHPDISRIESSENKRIGIDEIRTGIRSLDHRPTYARRRVCLVHDADTLTEEAANALLKTLEEPPGESAIILTAIHASAVPPTIMSRCAVLSLSTSRTRDILNQLETQGLNRTDATRIASLSDGRPALATFLSQHPEAMAQLLEDDEAFVSILQAPLHERIRQAEILADRLEHQPEHVFERWESVGRRILHASLGLPDTGPLAERIRSLAELHGPTAAAATLAALIRARQTLHVSSNPRLTLESLFLHLPPS